MRARKNHDRRPHNKYEVKAVQGELSGQQQALRACECHVLLCICCCVPSLAFLYIYSVLPMACAGM
jgi:hypothetical protein